MHNNPIWIYYLEIGIGSISSLACLLIFLIYYLCKEFRNFSFELVVYFILSNFLSTISYLINFIVLPGNFGIWDNKTLCIAQAFIMMWFEPAVNIWSSIISFYIYNNSSNVNNESYSTKMKKRILFFNIAFGLPLIYSTLALVCGVTGPSGMWCWVEAKSENYINTIFAFVQYILTWTSTLMNLTLCITALVKAGKIKDEEIRESVYTWIKGFCIIPLVTILMKLPGTFNRIIRFFDDGEHEVLEVMHAICNQLLGLLIISMIILIHKRSDMWNELRAELRIRCCCNYGAQQLNKSYNKFGSDSEKWSDSSIKYDNKAGSGEPISIYN
jgi:hypothetical protein